MRNGKSCKEAGFLGSIQSAKTKAEQKLARISRYDLNPNTCFNCSKSLMYEKRHNKFCSSSCCASMSNLGKVKNPNGINGKLKVTQKKVTFTESEPQVKTDKLCKFCSQITKKKNLVYCSSDCLENHKKLLWNKIKTEIEKNNGFSETDSYGRVKVMKRYLKETRGHKCSCCGIETWLDKQVPLTMDHIDGNASNNILSNLRLICSNCDSLSSTYKGRNRGKGRTYRRKG